MPRTTSLKAALAVIVIALLAACVTTTPPASSPSLAASMPPGVASVNPAPLTDATPTPGGAPLLPADGIAFKDG
jgi:hypothetical protein